MVNSERPAMPFTYSDTDRVEPGLSKREYLAGLALQGLLANPENIKGERQFSSLVAKAIINADDLLQQLEKK